MKLKCTPEDFVVEELSDAVPAAAGEFALYRLTKRGLGTPEAVTAVVRRWRLTPQQVSYGGLKDRHAVTTQFLTIRHGPRRDLRQTNLSLEYLGQSQRPFTSEAIAGNRFQVALRGMTARGIAAAETALDEIRRDGLPNYFDDQRFGSLGDSGAFVARAWIAGDFERSLWLAIAESNPHDRPRTRDEKQVLRDRWGDWPACRGQFTDPLRAGAAEYLTLRPNDFRGAFVRLPHSLRSLYLAAFQSFLWNRIADAFLREQCPSDRLLPIQFKAGALHFHRTIEHETRARLHGAELPLPSARTRLDPGPTQQLVDATLAQLGLTLRQIRVKYPRDSFFSKGQRKLIVVPASIRQQLDDDELYKHRKKWTVAFQLPRGSYATVLVKRVMAAVPEAAFAPADPGAETESSPES